MPLYAILWIFDMWRGSSNSPARSREGFGNRQSPRHGANKPIRSILVGALPYGESAGSTKRTQYRIQDPALRFWFRVYSPHRSRWRTYSTEEKRRLLREHASTVFEDYCRGLFPDAARYWERDLEFDLVRSDPHSNAERSDSPAPRHLDQLLQAQAQARSARCLRPDRPAGCGAVASKLFIRVAVT